MNSKRSKSHYDGKIAGLYDLEETIGKGHFAVVKLAKHVFTGEKVAVKVIDKGKLDEISKANLFQEVRCMKLVQHPNVVRLYEVIDTQTKLYLVLELGDGGDMYDYIMKHENGLNEDAARMYFKQIVQAISYCHKLHVVHRDLKPENVVFFEKLGIVKLTDFGFSNKYIPGSKLETSCGSLAYSAPEILLGDSYDAPAVDVWSLGVILFMLIRGEPPFQEANDSETLTMIMDCKYRMPSHSSKECQSLISKLLVRDPSRRANLDEIIHHPWLTRGDAVPVPLMPLISREHLSDEDHSYIVQCMVNGKIDTKEEILKSLEKNAYNHITATYYLLAERLLRKQIDQQHNNVNAARKGNTGRTSQDSKQALASLALQTREKQKLVNGIMITCTCEDPSDDCDCVKSAANLPDGKRRIVDSLVSPPGTRPTPSSSAGPSRPSSLSDRDRTFPNRRCGLIQEESIEEDEEEADTSSIRQSRSMEDCLSDDSGASERNESPSRMTPTRRHNAPIKPLHSVRSSPQLLNQIFEEEGESEEEDYLPRKLTLPRSVNRNSAASPEVIRKYESSHRKRITSGSRGTSCSSSDASDTDDTENKKRKDKLKHRFHRRDSSDHSSDTDGPSGPGGFGGGSRSLDGSGCSRDQDRDGRREHDKDNDKRDGQGNNSKTTHRSNKMSGKQNNTGIKHDQSESSLSDGGRKVSNTSIVSNKSIQSLTSQNSRSSKYLVDSGSVSPKSSRHSNTPKDVETLNEENKSRSSSGSKIIHVRSKDFSDLMERFTAEKESSSQKKDAAVKFRRRPKDKLKMDINSNGLIAHADNSLSEEENKDHEHEQNVAKTKCCSVI